MRRTLSYIGITLGVCLGLFFQQRNIDNKFCEITKQTREARVVALKDRAEQARIVGKNSQVEEIKTFHEELYRKYMFRLKYDPDLQEPINCEVHTK